MRRAGLLPIHRWAGLAFAPLLLLQALTGAWMVIHEGTGGAAPQRRFATPAASTFLASAEQALPGYRVKRLYYPNSAEASAFAELSDSQGRGSYAELDPRTGQATLTGALWRFPYRAALQIHYRLADGQFGMIVVLCNGIVLLLMALSGLLYWWPGRGRALKALAVRRNLPARFRLRQYHRTVGVIGAVVMLFSATTGILLIVPDIAPGAADAAPALPPRTAAQIDSALAMAQARFPASAPRDIRLPAADRLDINFYAPERNPRATHTISVRLSDGIVTKSIPAAGNPVLWMKVLSLHTGESFGPIGLLILLAEATALVFLGVAGPLMWYQARKRKAK